MLECFCPHPILLTEGTAQNHRQANPTPPLRGRRWAAYGVTAGLFLGLTACGGGDDPSSLAQASGTEPVINTTNFTRVAGEVMHSLIQPVSDFGSIIEGTFILNDVPPSVAGRSKLLRRSASARGNFQPQAAVSLSTDCFTSGRVKRTVSQAVQGQLAVGDFAVQQFDACVEDLIEFVGKGREVVTAVNAPQNIFTVQGELTGSGVTDLGTTTLVSGSYNMTTDRSVARRLKVTLSADKAINVERRLNQQTAAAYSYENLQRTIEFQSTSAVYDISYTLKGRFPILGSSEFQVSTPAPLTYGPNNGTGTGIVKIVGTDGSSMLLTHLGDINQTIRLDLDADGDGTIDQTQSLTFDTLLLPVLIAQ